MHNTGADFLLYYITLSAAEISVNSGKSRCSGTGADRMPPLIVVN